MNIKTLALGSLLGALLLTGCSDDDNKNTPTYPNGGSGGNSTTVIAPVAVADSFTGRANAQINGNVFANDTLNSATLTAHTAPGHGAVAIGSDGSFTYTPTTGFLGTDSFTYTLGNSAGNSTATVSITLAGTAFFVNNQAAAGGDGSQALPYQTLTAAVTAATGITGARIVVFQGDGTSTGYNTAVTLSSGQSLVGFSASAQPVLTGPVIFKTNNALENLKILGPSGVAVNATGAVNGTIQGVTIANDTSTAETVTLDNASGTFNISNCTVTNCTGGGFFSTSSSGSLIWSVVDSTFTNSTFANIGYELTGTAAHNLTVSNCTFNGGPGKGVVADANTTTTANLTMTNNTVAGGGTAVRGLDVLTGGTTRFTAIVSGNNITNCTSNGILVLSQGTSSAKLDFKNNSVIGNASADHNGDLEVVNNNAATIGAIFSSNSAGSYTFNQAGGTFSIEQFASFTSRNTGTLDVFGGSITDAASWSGQAFASADQTP